uniref:Uncharacterized protein n=1 Tax=Glossina austeni TaxID=7395 RepID=A0A1A9V1R1_GLOAU
MGDNDVESALSESPAIVTHATQATIDSHHLYPITPAANATRRRGDYNCSSTGSPKPACTLRSPLVNGILYKNLDAYVDLKIKRLNMRCSKYKEENFNKRQQTTDSGNSSEQKANDEDNEDYVLNRGASNTSKR